MASEITIYGDLSYTDSNGVTAELLVDSLIQDVSTKVTLRGQQTIATSETPINFGSVSSAGWLIIKNLDPTNYVDVKTAAAGTIFAHIPPGGICLLYLGSGVTAPVAVAHTAPCVIDKLICSQ